MATFSGRGLQGRIVESLGAQIVGGELSPGEIINLDALAQRESVSRTVIREAVKLLIGKGLLDARPRYGTFVRERDSWNLLDPDVMRWRSVGGPDSRLLEELDEVRRMLEPVSARLAAERRTEAGVRALEHAFEVMVEAHGTAEHVEADLLFHRLVAAASGNELLERLTGLLEPAQRTRGLLARHHLPGDTSYMALHRAVLEAVTLGTPKEAEKAMTALLESARRDLESIVTDSGG